MRPITLLVTALAILSFSYSFLWAADEKWATFSDNAMYELYKERVTEYCSVYKENDDTSETIYLIDEGDIYPDLSESWSQDKDYVAEAKLIFHENMDWIYGCATNLVHLRELESQKEILLNESEHVKAELSTDIEQRINDLNQKISQEYQKCKTSSENKDSILRKSVLKQVTYETCRYRFYVEYMKDYADVIIQYAKADQERILAHEEEVKNYSFFWLVAHAATNSSSSWDNVSIMEIIEKQQEKRFEIMQLTNELDQVYPYAFKSYWDYEWFFKTHLWLDLMVTPAKLNRDHLYPHLYASETLVWEAHNATRK